MTPPSVACLLRPARLLALAGLAAAAPAAAQDPCTGPGWVPHNVINYHFSWLSERRGNLALHCVRNHHSTRAVFVDWQGAGLRSAIPPGATIFRASPVVGRVSRRAFPFFYGARPNRISVPTLAGAAAPGPALAFLPAEPAALLRRAAYWEAEARGLPAGADASLVYVPTGTSASLVPRELAFQTLDVDPDVYSRLLNAYARVIERLESFPERLSSFAMTFDNRLTADGEGRVTVAWTCTYRLGPLLAAARPPLYLRFTDPDLHRRMFGGDEPSPMRGWRAAETVMAAELPPLAPRRLAARTARLEVLLDDRATIVATIPVAYSGPRGS